MRTAIGATAVNIATPTNLSARMIHTLLDNIRYISIEPCDMDKWPDRRRSGPSSASETIGPPPSVT
jgi:hypothetical protein